MNNKQIVVCRTSHVERSRNMGFCQSSFDSALDDSFSYVLCMIPDSYLIKYPLSLSIALINAGPPRFRRAGAHLLIDDCRKLLLSALTKPQRVMIFITPDSTSAKASITRG